jgi:serine/threonine protein phosphatase PrpC
LAACSYLLLCLHPDAVFTIHEGDCCLGVIDQDSEINWLSTVHCAPNWQGDLTPAQIAQESSRHSLTRCFSARRTSNPDINFWPARPNQHWLLASDGFWAGLCPQTQQLFLRDGHLPAPPTDDDISCLSVIPKPIF